MVSYYYPDNHLLLLHPQDTDKFAVMGEQNQQGNGRDSA